MNSFYWVLPDFNQEGKLWLISPSIENRISLSDFYKKYKIKEIAKEFEIGIPEELLGQFKSPKFGFAQIVKDHANKIFSISTRCGKDKDGRTVTLTYIQIVNELSEIQLPDQESLSFLETFNKDLIFQIDSETELKIDRLKKASLYFHDIKSFCSDKLMRTVYKHDWNGEDPTYSKKWIWLGVGVILLGILCLLTLKN